MHAMHLKRLHEPLEWSELADKLPGPGEVRVRVSACGVCRTDLHVVGHVALGDRVGVPWLGYTCGVCPYCLSGRENLCDRPLFNGYTRDGGYATAMTVDARYAFPLGEAGADASLAPLLCAGLIGWRALKIAGTGRKLGLYGFGAAAHIVAQVARWQKREVFAYTRPGDLATQSFARQLGVAWAGGSDETPGEALDAAIIFAPLGALVPVALKAVHKGGRVVCAGIHMSDIPSFPYEILWEERELASVANLTRADGHEFLTLAQEIGIVTQTTTYPLDRANQALEDLRHGRFEGAAVLLP
ncbi:MAG TPA: zinc-dependent alcohol dehydrogenase family protein [Steroidobacteraceae bacterium]